MRRDRTVSLTSIYANCSQLSSGCRIWKGRVDETGYPSIYDPSRYRAKRDAAQGTEGGSVSGRVLVWKLAHDGAPPPKGYRLLTSCGDPSCLERTHVVALPMAEALAIVARRAAERNGNQRRRRSAEIGARRRSKLTPQKVMEMRASVANGESYTEAVKRYAAELGMCTASIRHVIKGVRWKTPQAINSSVFNLAA